MLEFRRRLYDPFCWWKPKTEHDSALIDDPLWMSDFEHRQHRTEPEQRRPKREVHVQLQQ